MDAPIEQQASDVLNKIMEKAQPHLHRLSFLFGTNTKLTLIVQAEGQPGCLLISPHGAEIAELQKALSETAESELLSASI